GSQGAFPGGAGDEGGGDRHGCVEENQAFGDRRRKGRGAWGDGSLVPKPVEGRRRQGLWYLRRSAQGQETPIVKLDRVQAQDRKVVAVGQRVLQTKRSPKSWAPGTA